MTFVVVEGHITNLSSVFVQLCMLM